MKIAIDLRSLQSGGVSGVENYTLNLLEELLAIDMNNSYLLFFNGAKKISLPELSFINAKVKRTWFPNKILNLLFKFRFLTLEKLIGDFDLLFMPNLNVVNVSLKVKIIVTVHDLSFVKCPEFYDLKRKIWHKFLSPAKLFKRASRLLAVSKFTKNDLISVYNIDPQKIEVIYPGVLVNEFNQKTSIRHLREVRNVYALPKDFFLFLNTLEPRKNFINTIKAFENSDCPEHLVIAGKKGWKINDILKTIKNSSKKDKIHYIGYVNEEFKPAIIKLASALLYPSFYEGFGFQALEAMAVGTPTIVSQVSALPEVVGGGSILINPYNLRDIIMAMETLSKNDFLKDALVKKAELRVENFTWNNCAKMTLKTMEDLCV